MKKTFLIITLFLLVSWIGSIKVGYKIHQDYKRAKSNYTASYNGLREYYHGKLKAYQIAPQQLTRADAKELFSDEFQKLEKELKLKRVSQVIKIESSTAGTVKLEFKDTVIHQENMRRAPDTIPARVFTYSDENIYFKGINVKDSITVDYRYSPKVDIARSLEPRQGFWKKITLQPLKRQSVYTIIPGDPHMQINRFSVLEID